MNISELEKRREMSEMLSNVFGELDNYAIKYMSQSMKLNNMVQMIAVLDLPEDEYKVLCESLDKLLNMLHSKYDTLIQEKKKESEKKMVIIKIEDNKQIKRLYIEIERKNTTKLETLFANSISKHIDKLIEK